jgi:hypothetical protein
MQNALPDILLLESSRPSSIANLILLPHGEKEDSGEIPYDACRAFYLEKPPASRKLFDFFFENHLRKSGVVVVAEEAGGGEACRACFVLAVRYFFAI